MTSLHEFTVLRADDVRPSSERENQSEITDHNERERKLIIKESFLKINSGTIGTTSVGV